MTEAARAPGSSSDEYKAQIEKYFASQLIPASPSTKYLSFQNLILLPTLHVIYFFFNRVPTMGLVAQFLDFDDED